MAITLGKLTILVGAGILGSVLAKEGRVSDLVSGAFKIALKQIKQDDTSRSSSSVKKPNNDILMAQVNSLRQELQLLASSNHSVTIVTATQAGASKYGIIVITVVVGYGYIRWKGWRLPDMMFATRRSLSDACTTISKQLENVYSSIATTKRKMSSQIDGIHKKMDDCLENSASTQQDVFGLRGNIDLMGEDIRSVHHVVQTLETKISRIAGKQDLTNEGVRQLCNHVWNIQNEISTRVQAIPSSSSRPVIELPPSSPSRSGLLPLLAEPESPAYSSGSRMETNGLSEAIGVSNNSEVNGVSASEDPGSVTPSSGMFGMRFPMSLLTRTRSATSGIVQQARSTNSQRL